MDIITESLDQKLMTKNHHRVSQAERDANGQRWYKNRIDEIVTRGFSGVYGSGDTTHYTNMKRNYDLYNNKLNTKDLMYVTQPYGSAQGETPAKMTNRDIVSPKINSLIGMEIKRPFQWRVIAVNEDAITRKQKEENRMNTEFVVSQIMTPIRQQIEIDFQQQQKGRELTPEEQQQAQQQIAQELEKKTPDEVRKYMQRSYYDPAEVLNQQIMNYLIPELKLRDKFIKGFKHALLSGGEFYYRGIVNGEPYAKVVNPMYFDCDRSPDYDNVNEGEWAIEKFWMTPSQIVATFPDELETKEIDLIYHRFGNEAGVGNPFFHNLDENEFEFTFTDTVGASSFALPVFHVEFKSLRKIRFLSYLGPEGPEEMIVNDKYILKPEAGDITITEEWIPEVHEGYKIGGTEIYLSMRPVPGQHKDLENLHVCKLSYSGAFYDNLNSCPTAIMDRLVDYQYYYNIIMYRIEMLMASDRGKRIMMNINMIPKSAGIDIDKWLYYGDALGVMFYGNKEEGNKAARNTGNVGEMAKEIDMSLASQIQHYIELADYIDLKSGQAVGVPKQVEGEISPTDAVTNVKQVIVQSSNVLEPLFQMHNIIKTDFMNGLLETAKVAYATGKPKKLAYILDDMSMHMLSIDQELLDNNTCGIYAANSGKAADIKQTIEGLAHAAVQNQAIDLSDVIKVVRTEGIQEAEEILEVAEDKKRKEVQESQIAVEQQRGQNQDKMIAWEREKMELEYKYKSKLQKEDNDAELLQQTVLSAGFAEDKDMNDNNVPDVLDIAKHGLDVQMKSADLALKQQDANRKDKELDFKQKDAKAKNDLEEKKIQASKQKKPAN